MLKYFIRNGRKIALIDIEPLNARILTKPCHLAFGEIAGVLLGGFDAQRLALAQNFRPSTSLRKTTAH